MSTPLWGALDKSFKSGVPSLCLPYSILEWHPTLGLSHIKIQNGGENDIIINNHHHHHHHHYEHLD